LAAILQELQQLVLDDRVDMARVDAPAGIGMRRVASIVDDPFRNVVAIPDTLLPGVRGREPVTGLVEQDTGQQVNILRVGRVPALRGLVLQLLLDAFEGFRIDESLVLAFVDPDAVADLADIDRIGQQMPQIAWTEGVRDVVGPVPGRAAADDTPRAASSSLRPFSVRCGVWLIRSMMKSRCGARMGLR
jgi:hypothetical protein